MIIRGNSADYPLFLGIRHMRSTTFKTGLDPVYTRAKDSGFIMNPKRFRTGFILLFTYTAMNPVGNHLGFVMNP